MIEEDLFVQETMRDLKLTVDALETDNEVTSSYVEENVLIVKSEIVKLYEASMSSPTGIELRYQILQRGNLLPYFNHRTLV